MDAFRIGDLEVHPSLHRLVGSGETVTIEPRLMEVLVYLAQRPGQVVTRTQLLDEIWGEVVVNEEALTRAISELRRLLNDDSRQPRYIETIRKGGYRLLTPVQSLDGESVAQAVPPGAAPAPPRRRIRASYGWLVGIIVAAILWAALRGGGDPQRARSPRSLQSVPVTSYRGSEQTPAISPDGSMLAFAWNGPDENDFDIYLKPIDAETPRRLTETPGYDVWPSWDPDQRRLAYLHADAAGMTVRVVDIAGGEPRVVCDGGARLWGVDWSPDGRVLVYAAEPEPGAHAQLYVVSPDGGAFHPLLASPGEGGGDRAPAWSPDGKQLAFLRRDDHGREDIWLMAADGAGQARRLTDLGLWCRGLDWLPDGSGIVASLFVNGAYSLWHVDIASGRFDWVPATGEWLHSPSVARDGSLVYQHFWFEKNVWSVRRDDGALRTEALIASTRWDCEAHYSADGEFLAFSSARSGHLEVWMCQMDGSHARRLTSFQGATVGNPRFSPDGATIAFNASPEGVSQIHRVEREGAAVAALTDASAHRIMSDWSRDGQWLYYGTDENGGWEVWRLRVNDPAERQFVTGEGAVHARESFDGQRVFLAYHDRPGIHSMPVGGGEITQLYTELPAVGAWSNWGLSRTEFLFVRRAENGLQLVTAPLGGGDQRLLAEVPSVAAPSLELSPDGKIALYARIERSVGDLYLLPPGW